MAATQNRPETTGQPGESPDEHPPPAPDEDGPHDVPDETVIEKTLPSTPLPGQGGSRPGRP